MNAVTIDPRAADARAPAVPAMHDVVHDARSEVQLLILEKLDAMSAQVAFLAERQRKQQELIEEFTPIVKEMMKTATGKLDALEKEGVLAFGKELLVVGQRIAKAYTADDVRQLGDSVVAILDTVRAMTQPEILTAANEAAQVLQHADETQPIGLVGMVRATRNDDVQRGMAVMMEVLKKVGQGVAAASQRQAAQGDKRAKLQRLLGSKKRALGIERPQLPARAVQMKRPDEMPAAPACAVPSSEAPKAAAVFDGVAFTADGALVDQSQWTRELAATIAATQAVTMTDAHWALIEFARRDFEQTKASPNIRRMTQGTNLTTKDIYALFPKAPARTVSKIAGLPKPAGCL
ncbi:MAG: TusE/DsrC/DsvC family sulfur relay protein [Myxococcaceae bacterium]|nr:TusE/DsrC/DsvC family sulfur relay protein [Myxococcaceae bacterium]